MQVKLVSKKGGLTMRVRVLAAIVALTVPILMWGVLSWVAMVVLGILHSMIVVVPCASYAQSLAVTGFIIVLLFMWYISSTEVARAHKRYR